MFDVGPDNNLILIFLFAVALLISLTVFFATKKKILPAIFALSASSNLILYNDVGIPFYDKWFVVFTINYWPWLNLALFIILILVFVRRKLISKND